MRTAVQTKIGRSRSRSVEHNWNAGLVEKIDECNNQVALRERADRVAIRDCHRIHIELIRAATRDRSIAALRFDIQFVAKSGWQLHYLSRPQSGYFERWRIWPLGVTAKRKSEDVSEVSAVDSFGIDHQPTIGRPEGCPGGDIVMDSQIDQADFEQLLSRFSEGGRDPSERKRLGLLIECDQTRRQQYLEYCQIHAILRSEHGLLAAWSPPTRQADGEPQNTLCNSWRWRRQAIYYAAAAVFAVVITGVWLLTINRDRPPFHGAELAVLSKAVGAQFT
jgi:hypothetical protein